MTSLLQTVIQESAEEIGKELHRFAAELYPVCRSITGDGVRRTLQSISDQIPIEVFEVPTGTEVFDWSIPKEWNVNSAYVEDSTGQRVIDFSRHNLHLLNYSVPVRAQMALSELKKHLFTLPQHPDWIPYRTSYYKEDWGFCLPHRQLELLEDGDYEVHIDTSLEDGHLTYGECFLPGRVTDEVLISVHICHPSLANDNLSGIAVATALAKSLAARDRWLSYRFLFVPGTIGVITWLAQNKEAAKHVCHGLVLTCVGDESGFHYKKSRRGDAEIDRAMSHVLQHCGESSEILEFSPYGYDERQYCSPGFNLPVGCLMRSVWGTFPEYHTSADNLEFIRPESLAGSLKVCAAVVDVLENNHRYLNLNPHCEPQLGKRGLYRSTGGETIDVEIHARLWVLNLSDGEHSLLDIADRSGLRFATLHSAAMLLVENGLLKEVTAGGLAV